MSSGGDRRPVPEITSAPCSERTVMSSRPIGVPRRNTVYPRVSGCCAAAALAPSARTAKVKWRRRIELPIVSDAAMTNQDGYRTIRDGAALVEDASRARIAVSGKDRGSYLHGL